MTPALVPPSTRFRGGDVAVEAEDVVWVVAVLEGDEAFPVLGGMGGSYPLGARAVELHEIDVGVAGLEGTRRFGHVGEVGHNPFSHLRREGWADPVHDEPGVALAHGAQTVGGACQGAAELPELQYDQGRAGICAGYLHERFDGLGRELPQHLGVLAGSHGIDRVHAYGVHRRKRHGPEGVHDRLAQLLAEGTHQLFAGLWRLSAVAAAQRYHGLAAKRLGERGQRRDVQERYSGAHLVGELGAPAGVGIQHLFRLLHRIDKVTAVEGPHGIEVELQGGNYSEVAAPTPEPPEQLGVLLGAQPHQLAVCGDYVCLPHARGVEAVLAPQPPEAAAHGVTDNADVGGGAHETGQAVRLGLVDQVG